MAFIPANESPFIISFFKIYSKWLMKYSFRKVWLKEDYHPNSGSKTIYYLNHTMWWDGLIPLVLNEYKFKQKARAIMEEKQMKDYAFFSKIGAFSINLDDQKDTLRSLRYAIDSMNRSNSSLFIYPEGELIPLDSDESKFKSGLAWLAKNLDEVDFVPICIYPSFHFGYKPDLIINVGESVSVNKEQNKEELTQLFQDKMMKLKDLTIAQSIEPEKHLKPLF